MEVVEIPPADKEKEAFFVVRRLASWHSLCAFNPVFSGGPGRGPKIDLTVPSIDGMI